jgi:hypothetical protein
MLPVSLDCPFCIAPSVFANVYFQVVTLKSSLRTFYSRHHDLINRNGISVSQITTDMLRLSSSESGLFLIHEFSPGL